MLISYTMQSCIYHTSKNLQLVREILCSLAFHTPLFINYCTARLTCKIVQLKQKIGSYFGKMLALNSSNLMMPVPNKPGELVGCSQKSMSVIHCGVLSSEQLSRRL